MVPENLNPWQERALTAEDLEYLSRLAGDNDEARELRRLTDLRRRQSAVRNGLFDDPAPPSAEGGAGASVWPDE